jgi:hypothetical protein
MSAMANGKEAKDVEKEKRPLKMAQSTTASWKMDMDMGNGIVKVKVSTTGSGKTTRRTISGLKMTDLSDPFQKRENYMTIPYQVNEMLIVAPSRFIAENVNVHFCCCCMVST